MNKLLSLLTLTTFTLLTACFDFGSDDDDDSGGTEYFGYFLDAGVVGLSYSPNDGFEWTQGNGRFFYNPGQSTDFSILGLSLGSATVDSDNPVVTPATLLGEGSLTKAQMETLLNGSSATAQAIKNQLVLLQTLDFDQNPDNGIDLPKPVAIDSGFIPSKNALSDLNLNASATDFAAALEDKLVTLRTNGALNQSSVVISEEDAIEHFLETLDGLESLADYEGRWAMRSGGSGDVSAMYTFNSNLSIELIEYDDCPGNLYGASEQSLIKECSPVEINQTFTTNGTQFILKNDDITDTCVTLSANSHEIFASCNFQGSGLGSEVIRLQRAPLEFNATSLHSQYKELQAGSSTITTFNFNTDNNTGSYSSSDESGNVTWTFEDSGNALQFTTDFDDTTHQFIYQGFVKGNWLTGSTNITNILRNVENTTTATQLKQSGFFGVFDITPGSATEGECKEVRYGNSGSSTQITFDTYDNASGQSYACDYPRDWDQLPPTKTETFIINSAYIESTSSNDDRRCYLLGIDDYELDNLYVACEVSGNHNKFEIELWRGL